MSPTVKSFSGPEFAGTDEINRDDTGDWVVEGMGGDIAKNALDDFDWNGSCVLGITLKTTSGNRRVSNANIFLTGEFMKSPKDIKASWLFPDASKDL